MRQRALSAPRFQLSLWYGSVLAIILTCCTLGETTKLVPPGVYNQLSMVILPLVIVPVMLALPPTVSKFVLLSNVKLALAPKSLLLLNWICVFEPAGCCMSNG